MKRIIALGLLVALLGTQEIHAQSINLEIDPIPYALNGFSVAAGVNMDHMGYEIEVFGIEVPEAFHGNEGFTRYVWGVSAKADYYFRGADDGLFTGIDVDVTSARYTLNETGGDINKTHVSAGLTFGYKVKLTDDLYVTPWAGLGYMFNADDLSIDGEMFQQNALRPFPALSIGWQF